MANNKNDRKFFLSFSVYELSYEQALKLKSYMESAIVNSKLDSLDSEFEFNSGISRFDEED